MDEHYQGKPMIVDLWNTWCGPCLSAHKEIEHSSEIPDNIVMLYISDTSSPIDQWHSLSHQIGGEQVRISSKDMQTIGELYGLNGFPSYIFINSRHDIIHKQVGFPGLHEYIRLAELIK
ncbi:TlpA disulfide reductase family protein [Duncaniella freteri]|uniref:TlpA family protein disulfide reductase n=2 Tax=Duncaniella freteri TaxID=2530391 RepID=UPI0025B78850|nr:TlpA disulfide reductase family protein [uncultured Duncaniella sp.]